MKITCLTTYGFGQKSIIESDLSKNKTKSLVHQDLYTLFSHVLIYDTIGQAKTIVLMFKKLIESQIFFSHNEVFSPYIIGSKICIIINTTNLT